MKKMLSGVFVFVLAATSAWAQPAKPVFKKPLSLGQAAEAIRTNDQRLLNTDCMRYVEAFNETFKPPVNERPATCEALAKYYELLNVDEAPPGTQASFTRIMPNGKPDLYGFSRPTRPGEQWAYDNQMGVWVVSLLCGNFVSKNELPLPRQQVEVSAPGPKAAEAAPKAADHQPAQIATAAAESAKALAQAPQPEVPAAPSHRRYRWYDPRGGKGKLLWAGVAGGLAGAWCAETDCLKQEVNVTQNVYIK